jgi:glyoxylase-like metal-dependent hydrolase (beta-lactamase superfamily II)
VLSDGVTSLLLDLPYEPGAFGYQRYDPARLQPAGEVVAVITHHHRDHFAPDLFLPRPGWRVIGPPSAVAVVPPGRVTAGDSVAVGAFQVVAVPTPHTDDHRSYRIRWRGRVLHFTGDTEYGAALLAGPRVDLLFLTPWLACTLEAAGRAPATARAVLYHRNPDGSDRRCGSAEPVRQGTRFTMPPAP